MQSSEVSYAEIQSQEGKWGGSYETVLGENLKQVSSFGELGNKWDINRVGKILQTV